MQTRAVHAVIIRAGVAVIKSAGRGELTFTACGNTRVICTCVIVVANFWRVNALSVHALVICAKACVSAVSGLINALSVYAAVNRADIVVVADNRRKGTLPFDTDVLGACIAVNALGNMLAASGNAVVGGAGVAIFTGYGNVRSIHASQIICNYNVIFSYGDVCPVNILSLCVRPCLGIIFKQAVIQIGKPHIVAGERGDFGSYFAFIATQHLKLHIIDFKVAGRTCRHYKIVNIRAIAVVCCYDMVIARSKRIKIHLRAEAVIP